MPAAYTRADGRPAAAALARRMIEAGIADAGAWPDAAGDPFVFVKAAMDGWAAEVGADVVGAKYIGVGALIASDIDQMLWEEPSEPRLEELWLVFFSDYWHSIVHMGHVTTLLERVHPRLPATWYAAFTAGLQAVARIWDHRVANEWYYMYGDHLLEVAADEAAWAAENGEDPPEHDWPIEATRDGRYGWDFRVKELRLPALQQKPLADSTVRKLRRTMPERVQAIMDRTRELARTAEKAPRPWPEGFFDDHRTTPDAMRPGPILVFPMERHDAIERAWDEENMQMGQMGEPVLPYMAIPFDATDDESLRGVRRDFQTIARVFALAEEIVGLLPEHDPGALVESLREVDG